MLVFFPIFLRLYTNTHRNIILYVHIMGRILCFDIILADTTLAIVRLYLCVLLHVGVWETLLYKPFH